jgi:hypothetical protein
MNVGPTKQGHTYSGNKRKWRTEDSEDDEDMGVDLNEEDYSEGALDDLLGNVDSIVSSIEEIKESLNTLTKLLTAKQQPALQTTGEPTHQ